MELSWEQKKKKKITSNRKPASCTPFIARATFNHDVSKLPSIVAVNQRVYRGTSSLNYLKVLGIEINWDEERREWKFNIKRKGCVFFINSVWYPRIRGQCRDICCDIVCVWRIQPARQLQFGKTGVQVDFLGVTYPQISHIYVRYDDAWLPFYIDVHKEIEFAS